ERPFASKLDGRWIGAGISYGAYREGQAPMRATPSKEELTEDLEILLKRWNLIRVYGSREVSEDVLQIIREKKLPMRVMLGAWITREIVPESNPPVTDTAAVQANRQEVAAAIRLAKAYPEIVVAVSVGNETQVYWSGHRTRPELLLKYLREVRLAVSQPVTTADDFNFWNKPESQPVAKEVDFIVTHIHALWAGLEAPGAMDWTRKVYGEVCQHHPNKTVVIGEAGWATQVHNEGEQAELIKGEANERTQATYYRDFTRWANEEKICTFFFEAFDESWKGGPHPNEVEKHWGLFDIHRQPKAAMAN
ncbi:hypothetical protein OAS39_12120, partial [Pirellulales bacterium]|nr:hypothetical protein [Pirellulales bacterium]